MDNLSIHLAHPHKKCSANAINAFHAFSVIRLAFSIAVYISGEILKLQSPLIIKRI